MYKQLTSEQRYTISVLLQKKCTRNEIAKAIGVSNSTITRELRRNSSTRGVYKWDKAQRLAEKRKHQVPGNRSIKPFLRDMAIDLLKRNQWSPEQISGHLARKGYKISHETIYAIIRKDKYENRGSLYKHCRHRLKHRHRPVGKRVIIPDRTSIHQRPPEADGKRFGDFEMDTIMGNNNQGAILTMVERSTNMLFMRKLKHGKDADELAHGYTPTRSIQRIYKDYNNRQRNGILQPQGNSNGAGHHCLLHRSVFIMAERSHRECKRTHQTIYTQVNTNKTSKRQRHR